jgi:hypothetical protein
MQHPHMPVGSVGAVAVNDGDGEGGCFCLGHVVCLFDRILQTPGAASPTGRPVRQVSLADGSRAGWAW